VVIYLYLYLKYILNVSHPALTVSDPTVEGAQLDLNLRWPLAPIQRSPMQSNHVIWLRVAAVQGSHERLLMWRIINA